MSKYLQVQIPKACHEDWDKMDAAAQGKFCNSCQKNVIDFTLMSDTEVVNFFKKNTGNVCGRFYTEQLNTDMRIPVKKIPWLKYFFQIAIPAFLFSSKANAQTNDIKGKVACIESPVRRTIGEIRIDTSKTESGKIAQGKIVDEAGQPVAGASVMVKDTRQGTAADSNGEFSIKVSSSNTLLVISAVGYISQEVNISGETSRIITMKTNIMGEVIIVAGMVARRTTRPFLSLTPVKPNSVTPFIEAKLYSFMIFPNPVTTNSKLNIKWKDNIASNQAVEIYSLAGEILQQEVIMVNKKITKQSISLRQLPAGTYVIKITDSKTSKTSSQQFIVQ